MSFSKMRPTQRAATVLNVKAVVVFYSVGKGNNSTRKGDAFACRYEAYLTDYRVEPRKTKWQVDLAFRLRD